MRCILLELDDMIKIILIVNIILLYKRLNSMFVLEGPKSKVKSDGAFFYGICPAYDACDDPFSSR